MSSVTTMSSATAMEKVELEMSVNRFVAQESQYLAQNDWDNWLDLFEPDGVYWMPAQPQQTDPLKHVSLIYETAALRELRVRRFKDDIALSLQPKPRTVRHISNMLVAESDDAIHASASLYAAQYAYGDIQQFHGHVSWDLHKHDDSYRISQKRVELINCDGGLSDILTYL